jgi:hypothetical protein
VLVAVPVLATAACSGQSIEPPPTPSSPNPPSTTATPGAAHGTERHSGGAVVISGADAAATVAVSRALFDSSTVVVVVTTADAEPLAAAGAAAAALGAPLLLASDALADEVTRLQARTVLAYPSAVGLTLGDVEVVPGPADPASLAEQDIPVPLPVSGAAPTPVVLTTSASPTSPALLAAVRAAGVEPHSIASADPRRAGATATAMHDDPQAPVLALGSAFGSTERFASRVLTVRTAPQIPGGGWVPFPDRRMAAIYGHPGTPSLGALGQQGIASSVTRAKRLAAALGAATSTKVVPAFEIIATVAAVSAGPDHNFSTESAVSTLRPWVDAAGKAGVYVVLDLQSGRSEFLKQAKLYAPLLSQPHVGLALDPEWRLAKKQRPLKQVGSVDADEINAVIVWLADLVQANGLPPKVLAVHQFSTSMIRRRYRLDTSHDQVQVVIHADGQGSRTAKFATWRTLRAGLPRGVFLGWKNFYRMDSQPMNPAETMRLVRPIPSFVSYQ